MSFFIKKQKQKLKFWWPKGKPVGNKKKSSAPYPVSNL